MKIIKHCAIISFLILSIFESFSATDLPCGDWEPFKGEKCFKIFDKAGFKSYADAEKVCQDNSARLISIDSSEEQEFVANFLFKKNKVEDNLWIGAQSGPSGVNHEFHWEDGSRLTFTNWAPGCPKKNQTNYCVQMHAEIQLAGKWDDQSCTKKNLVVCQKRQAPTMAQMQDIVLRTEKRLEGAKAELAKENEMLKHSFEEVKRQFSDFKKSAQVPVGFVYVQLASEKAPAEIWPSMTWSDVTSSYAGLFFRAEGGGASAFGQVQDGSAPRLTEVNTINTDGLKKSNPAYCTNYLCSLRKDAWSGWLWTGNVALGSESRFIRFHSSGGEVRPRNMAMRIWKRTG